MDFIQAHPYAVGVTVGLLCAPLSAFLGLRSAFKSLDQKFDKRFTEAEAEMRADRERAFADMRENARKRLGI